MSGGAKARRRGRAGARARGRGEERLRAQRGARPRVWGGGRSDARRDVGGFVATELTAGLGLLVLPVAILVVTLPVWSEVQAAGRAAAQQAARAAVLAPDDARARRDAAAAAASVLANHGRDLAGPVRLDGSVGPGAAPQALVTATVTVRLPLVGLPMLGELASVDWDVSHSQPVDVYRSYPAGTGG